MNNAKRENRISRHRRVRSKVFGTKTRPRLSVFRSNKLVYLQIIDDESGKTLFSASGKNPQESGKTLADKALKAGIKEVVFDRGGYKYHGRVAKIGESARAAGLKF